MTTVIGIDPSLAATGWAGPEGVATIKSKPTANTSIAARSSRLDGIVARITEHIPSHSLVVIEGPGFSTGAESGAHIRAGLWWRIANAVLMSACEVVEVTPTSLKKFATGKGNARKDDMRMALYKRTGLDYSDDNQVDAWWLRQVGLHLIDDPDALPLPAVNMSALEKVHRA